MTKSSQTGSAGATPAENLVEAPPAPLLDLHRLFVAIRRRKRLWLATALLGLIAGALVAVLLPAPPTAVTKIIVVHQDDSPTDSGTLMRTDVAVLSTTQIAAGALKRLGSTQSPEDFMKNYAGLGITNNVMQITVKAKSDAEAVAQAKALADTFIADHVDRSQAAAAAQSKAILDQRKNAQDDLGKIDAQIADETAKGRSGNATTLEALFGRRSALTAKISDLDTRAQQAGIGSPQVAAGTTIVDAPRALPKTFLKTTATNAGIGFALGLALGIAFAAIGAVSRDRPVLRREISNHLGASVIAQLPSKQRRRLIRSRTPRAVSERKRVATTLVRAIQRDIADVSLLELGAPKVAAALALDVVEELAETGPASVLDDLPAEDVRQLAAAAGSEVAVVGAGDPAGARGEIRIGVGTVAPGTAWTDLEHLGTETVLVVKAGFANTTWLHTVARQLADQQIPIIGVVLVDPDPRDKSDGTLWDGLHTALRGRTGSAAPMQRIESEREDRIVELATRVAERVALVDLPTRKFAPVRPMVPPVAKTLTPLPGPQSSGPSSSGPQSSGPQSSGPQVSGPQKSVPQKPGSQKSGPQSSESQSSRPQVSGPQKPAPQKPGPQPSMFQSSGPQSSESQLSGPQSSGPQSSGSQASGSQKFGPQRSESQSGSQASGPQKSGPQWSESQSVPQKSGSQSGPSPSGSSSPMPSAPPNVKQQSPKPSKPAKAQPSPQAKLPEPGTVSVPHADAPTKKFAPVKKPRPTPFKRDHGEPMHQGELNAELESEKSAEVS